MEKQEIIVPPGYGNSTRIGGLDEEPCTLYALDREISPEMRGEFYLLNSFFFSQSVLLSIMEEVARGGEGSKAHLALRGYLEAIVEEARLKKRLPLVSKFWSKSWNAWGKHGFSSSFSMIRSGVELPVPWGVGFVSYAEGIHKAILGELNDAVEPHELGNQLADFYGGEFPLPTQHETASVYVLRKRLSLAGLDDSIIVRRGEGDKFIHSIMEAFPGSPEDVFHAISHLPMERFTTFANLVREYNEEWALASFEWSSSEKNGEQHETASEREEGAHE